jgi:hypothetical protein
VQDASWRRRVVVIAGIAAAIAVGIAVYTWRTADDEVRSVASTNAAAVSGTTDLTPLPSSRVGGSGDSDPGRMSARLGSAAAYPVNLEALRARIPDNRYWALAAPTSDPEVAKARAARAEQDNAMFGRIQANEASPEEIRAYYAERRAVSRDFLALAELVLREQGSALPARDVGMFELSANLHRARLQQIDRDEADALARLAAR